MEQLFGTGYIPLGDCFKWSSSLLTLMVLGNLLAATAFFTMPLAVFSYLKRSQHRKYHWIFILFTASCIACATAHAVKIWTVYQPVYALEAALDFVGGAAFLATAVLVWPLIPKVLALPQPAQMEKAHDELKTEMTRRESAEYRNRQLASIVESSNDAIVSFLLNGTVLSWNRGAQELFGYSVESTMGKTMRQLIGPDMDKVVEVLREDKKLDTLELPFTTSEGKTIYLSLCVSPIKDAEGRVVSGAAIFRDITLFKQAERELLRASEQLTQSNKELEDFAWVAAHDLKEPVRTMGTYSKLLKQEYEESLDEQAEQFLEFIHGSSITAMARIDDVLKFGAVRREKFEAHVVNLNDVVASVMQDLNSSIKESHANIVIPKELPKVLGKSEYLSLLLQNICSNAIKYRNENVAPQIEITAEQVDDMWRISVKDNGIGFEMEHKDKIFQMFQRLHRDSEYPGTGLGLAMCKKIVELHGGKIWTESVLGEGTTFYFTVPAAPVAMATV
jgi:PAS domain S-box-containing protein